jgi:ABC-type branched-subunit amino acid transport system substrate-binding protein
MPAIISTAQKKGVLLVTPSAAIEAFSEKDRTWAVSFYNNSTTEIQGLLDSLRARNLTKIALVYEQEPFSETLRKLITANDSPLIADIGIQAGESDFRAHLMKLRKKKIDVVVVLVWEQRSLLSLLQQLRTHLPSIPLATVQDGAGWLEIPALRSALPRLIYTQFVLADPSFKERFKNRFGYAPILTASNAYDALHAVMSALAAGAQSGAACRQHILNSQLQSATFGSFRFNSDGSVPSKVELVEYDPDTLKTAVKGD